MDSLPLRINGDISRTLRATAHQADVLSWSEHGAPRLLVALSAPAAASVSLQIQVLSRTGVPLAKGVAQVAAGSLSFATNLTFFGMEGYAHLAAAARREVEERVWTRRASVTAVRHASAAISG